MDKQQLIAELNSARQRLNDVLSRVDDKKEIYPTWKLKQVLDHVAGWDDAVIASIQSHARGEVPAVTAPRGIDYYNAETVTTREALPLTTTRMEFEATRLILKELILSLSDEKYAQPFIAPWGSEITVAQLVNIFVHHEIEHAQEIEQILQQA
ncbi:MAG: DinB family protein [Anaerolineales bacterium]|nr:DinB family protein [Anaerolineales bacterium]